MNLLKKIFSSSYIAIILILIYVPLILVVVYSFSNSSSATDFSGHTTSNYSTLFKDTTFVTSLLLTLLIAFVATFISVIIGTLAAIGISKVKRITKTTLLTLNNIPLINADIVTAISLMVTFLLLNFNFGLPTLILAHISFDIPYIVITVLPALRKVNPQEVEASMDLGASPLTTLRKIILPKIKFGIFSGAAIAFAMSFDDFIISYFVGGSSQNVSTYIYTLRYITPAINAFGTVLLIVIIGSVFVWNVYKTTIKFITNKNQKKSLTNRRNYNNRKTFIHNKFLSWFYSILSKFNLMKNSNQLSINLDSNGEYSNLYSSSNPITGWSKFRSMPWKIIFATLLIIGAFSAVAVEYAKFTDYDLSIAIWSDYLPSDVVRSFEQQYNVKVKVALYDSNETLEQKLYTTKYDIIVPSDYMAARFATEGLAAKIDWTKLTSSNDCKNIRSGIPCNFNPSLWQAMKNYPIKLSDGAKSNLTDYQIPYFWGDVRLGFNLDKAHKNLLSDLDLNHFNDPNQWSCDTHEPNTEKNATTCLLNPKAVNWEILNKAAAKGYKILMSDDVRNTFMVPLEIQHQQVSPTSEDQIVSAYNYLKSNIQRYKPIWMTNGDIDTPFDKEFGVGVFYGGTILNMKLHKNAAENLITVVPHGKSTITGRTEGVNLWVDGIQVLKSAPHKTLAYKFINYLLSDKTQQQLVKETGYPSTRDNVSQELLLKNDSNPAYDEKLNKYQSAYWVNFVPNNNPYILNGGMSQGTPGSLNKYPAELFSDAFASKITKYYNELRAS